MSIVTKKGDAGETTLLSGRRVKKCDLRLECMGEVDEAAAFVGVARAKSRGYIEKSLRGIQEGLSRAAAELADDAHSLPEAYFVTDAHVAELEHIVDYCEGVTGPMKGFVTPGDNPLSADLHVARTVVRRAERHIAALHAQSPLRPELLRYMNRLSDALFALARLSAEGPNSKITPL